MLGLFYRNFYTVHHLLQFLMKNWGGGGDTCTLVGWGGIPGLPPPSVCNPTTTTAYNKITHEHVVIA